MAKPPVCMGSTLARSGAKHPSSIMDRPTHGHSQGARDSQVGNVIRHLSWACMCCTDNSLVWPLLQFPRRRQQDCPCSFVCGWHLCGLPTTRGSLQHHRRHTQQRCSGAECWDPHPPDLFPPAPTYKPQPRTSCVCGPCQCNILGAAGRYRQRRHHCCQPRQVPIQGILHPGRAWLPRLPLLQLCLRQGPLRLRLLQCGEHATARQPHLPSGNPSPASRGEVPTRWEWDKHCMGGVPPQLRAACEWEKHAAMVETGTFVCATCRC